MLKYDVSFNQLYPKMDFFSAEGKKSWGPLFHPMAGPKMVHGGCSLFWVHGGSTPPICPRMVRVPTVNCFSFLLCFWTTTDGLTILKMGTQIVPNSFYCSKQRTKQSMFWLSSIYVVKGNFCKPQKVPYHTLTGYNNRIQQPTRAKNS